MVQTLLPEKKIKNEKLKFKFQISNSKKIKIFKNRKIEKIKN
jgi:hypothetical protein